jgi:hypothetical protein
MSLGFTSDIDEIAKHLLDRSLITTHGHVKGRCLSRKANAHYDVFLRKGKATKGMST